MNVLVTGGAGYIGSHTVRDLLRQGHQVLVLDDLSKGHRKALPESSQLSFYLGGTGDRELLDKIFTNHSVDAVVHFAAFSLVGESMDNPAKYFANNLANGLLLLDRMLHHSVKKIVFSSTAAVYGEPEQVPILEEAEKRPTNNYGLSKLMFEQILNTYDKAYGLKSVSLRYFNAAGADPSGEIGEDHSPETHLIPLIFQAALGQRKEISIFGTDYPTPDGTCQRDYIHVSDLAQAHILALEALMEGCDSKVYNLGNGRGFSVREIISVAEKVSGKVIPVVEAERRAGDPAILVAGSEKIKRELNWSPRFSAIEDILSTAWAWHSAHPAGYQD